MKRVATGLLAASLVATMIPGQLVLADKGNAAVRTTGFENTVNLEKLGSYISGKSNADGGVAEIVSYDAVNNKAWVVNGATGMLDIIDITPVTSAVSNKMEAKSLNVKELVDGKVAGFTYGDMTSVSVNAKDGIVAVALQDAVYNKEGYVAILTTEGELVTLVEAGCQPDMVTFTPDGNKILVANEGEPREGYGEGVVDPAGSVTLITVDKDDLTKSSAVTVGFEAFDDDREALVESGVIFVKGQKPSTDFEPEYIAADNNTAYVALQESNAIAVFDIASTTFTGVYSLGYKDLSLEKNAVDLVEDGSYIAKTYPDAVGAYMPDGISLYSVGGKTYILTANEGDAREWGSNDTEYVNEIKETLTGSDGTKAKKVRVIDPQVTDGLPIGKNVLYGGRSFSIYEVSNQGLTQVFDSNNDLEEMTAAYIPEYFNCSNDDNEYDSRSPKKGIEPESVTVGTVDGKTYAFLALERISGIMMYDITNPANVKYVNYINTRDFEENPEDASADDSATALKSDIAPEGLFFINSEVSPSKTPILLAAFEVSGTVSAFSVGEKPVAVDTDNNTNNDNNSTENDNNTDINLGNGGNHGGTGVDSTSPETGESTSGYAWGVLVVCIAIAAGVFGRRKIS